MARRCLDPKVYAYSPEPCGRIRYYAHDSDLGHGCLRSRLSLGGRSGFWRARRGAVYARWICGWHNARSDPRRYRPALFPQTDRQREKARGGLARRASSPASVSAIEMGTAVEFHVAAAHHQNYKLRRYEALAAPIRDRVSDEGAFARSPAATLANAYVAGHRPLDRLDEDRERLALSAEALDRLRERARRHQGWRAFVRST